MYAVPSHDQYPFLSNVIKSIRDYYPLWQVRPPSLRYQRYSDDSVLSQLVYQTTVFLSRSSISLGIPALPSRLLSLPAIIQFFVLLTLIFESTVGFFPEGAEGSNITLVFLLICLEGFCGGSA